MTRQRTMIHSLRTTLTWALFLLLTTSLVSCGEDRTKEFEEKTMPNPWIYDVMELNYLYYSDLPELEDKDYFEEATDFFESLLSDKDGKNGNPFSYVEVTASTKSETNLDYGWDLTFYQITDENGVTQENILVRVNYVYPGSPADQAGLERGDVITQRNGENYTSSNYQELAQQTDAATLTLLSEETVSLPAATDATYNPILDAEVLNHENYKVGYLAYSKFIRGTDEANDESYDNALRQTFSQTFAPAGIDAFVLDLRYNRGGDIRAAQLLTSMLAPSSVIGQRLFYLEYNDKQDPQITSFLATNDVIGTGSNLNLSKIYILTSSVTASASELVISALIPYMGTDNIVLIGDTTYGKNVAMAGFTHTEYPDYTFWPVVASVCNDEGFNDYIDGFPANHEAKESTLSSLGALGSTDELLLSTALNVITGKSNEAEESRVTTRTTTNDFSTVAKEWKALPNPKKVVRPVVVSQ